MWCRYRKDDGGGCVVFVSNRRLQRRCGLVTGVQTCTLPISAEPATIARFVAGEIHDNAFEPLLRRREPAIAQALDALSRVGLARITGTGAGCFAAYDSHEAACAACVALPELLQAREIGRAHV